MLIPMSPTDSMFLLAESENCQMQVGGLALFSPPEGARAADVRQMFTTAVARDSVAGMWRKRARRSLTSLGQWGWDTSSDVDLNRHVHYSALPSPAGMADLWTLVSWLHATPLSRELPLWELHLIEGLADGRYAVYIKVHHALTDGVSAMGMLRAALSSDPSRRGQPALWEPVEAVPEPAPAPRMGSLGLFGLPRRAAATAWGAARETAELAPALAGVLVQALCHHSGTLSLFAPHTMLNVPIRRARSFTGCSWPLERLRLVAEHSDTTVNDVVLAMCAGALRSYLDSREALPLSPLVAMVPVSLRGRVPEGSRVDTADSGNRIGSLMCDLATNVADPGKRLAAVHTGMREGKAALGTRSQLQILAMSALGIAPLGLGMLLGHIGPLRPPNVMISNVSGSPVPLYWNGARLDALYPLSIPVDGQALNITCTSTDDTIAFGLTGCRHAVPGLNAVAGLLDDELRLLEHAAGL
ncbi:WS/DGAT/MGAT family O-acyltransferase [[Mycobacterium] nativiensis]|uniref:Diacylglycerol O-acyltransferase n=1 Tax=[Mycobacterium] nativiensis TaxID=2855503 RepID=A0ABU5Y3U6_9MYCO|nr:wax ester/triacylglycerol synthase family O-acyltransferase [Mycolicibacter sp. MYC340]MEB3034737.1 wax ester/triacylglycerol synthase family O-acyltransferase [Mycolicibacter sp. MYC340]